MSCLVMRTGTAAAPVLLLSDKACCTRLSHSHALTSVLLMLLLC
jgi:hypothetical protein